MNELFLNDFFRRRWERREPFAAAFALEGEVFRAVKARRTFRIVLDGRGFFVKLHRGIGWREIFKDLLQGKRPVLGAGNEFRACRRLAELGVGTMNVAAYGARGWNPARLRSFLITDELAGMTSLEDVCRPWPQQPPAFAVKAALIARLGGDVGAMHRHGINHRDCYLCHFLLDDATRGSAAPRLHVIDLHRAQIRKRVPYRYLVKDVGGLFFSAMEIGLTRRDLLRFVRAYTGRPLRRELAENDRFWRDVRCTAEKLFRKIHAAEPPETMRQTTV